MMRLEIETDFTRNFRRGSPIVTAYTFIEDNLGGAGVWDIMIPAPAKLDDAYVRRVLDLERELRAITIRDDAGQSVQGLTKVLSLVDGIEAAGINPLLERIPPELKARGMAATMPNFVKAPAHGVRRTGRTALFADHVASAGATVGRGEGATHRARDERWRNSISRPPPTAPAAQVTGYYVLLTNLINSILRDQWACFAVATVGVGIMIAIAFRSLVLACVALVPNVLPVFVVMGTMGWLGLKVNMGAAMIAAVSMGLSVDSSIHYISFFLRARAAGLSVPDAISDVQQSVGRSATYSTLALMVGFLALCSSQFVPTIYFGCLVSLAMLGGLVGNVVVLPFLLRLVTAPSRTG